MSAEIQTNHRHELSDNGEYEVACGCGLHIDATPPRELVDEARQMAFEAGGLEGGEYHLADDELEQVLGHVISQTIIEREMKFHDERGHWALVSDRLPEVPEGDEQEVIVCVRRAHNGQSYVFSARYLNKYPLYNEFHPDADEDGCLASTGWHDVKEHSDYDGWYSPLIEAGSGDEVTHWMSLPVAPEVQA